MDMRTLAATTLTLFASTYTFADTCPTQLIKEHDGHWVSHQKPGWRSSEKTEHGTQINVKDFGGALYSPKEKRLVCVYRSTQGFWIAMISNTPDSVQIQNNMHHHAWHWDKKHHDYTCGRPNIIDPRNCQFKLHS